MQCHSKNLQVVKPSKVYNSIGFAKSRYTHGQRAKPARLMTTQKFSQLPPPSKIINIFFFQTHEIIPFFYFPFIKPRWQREVERCYFCNTETRMQEHKVQHPISPQDSRKQKVWLKVPAMWLKCLSCHPNGKSRLVFNPMCYLFNPVH